MSEGSYVQFGIDGVPFSAVRVELTGDTQADIDRAMDVAWALKGAYESTFRSVQPEPEYDHPRAPQQNGRSAGNQWGFYCQQHNADLMPSVKNKTMEWDDAVQAEVPASWFHTLADGKSCSVWRSKAGIRQAVGSR